VGKYRELIGSPTCSWRCCLPPDRAEYNSAIRKAARDRRPAVGAVGFSPPPNFDRCGR